MKIRATDGKSLTSMHCGGAIAQLMEVESLPELIDLVGRLPDFHVLGGGTNTIFADAPTTTPVIKLGQAFDYLRLEGDRLYAGAACQLHAVLMFCRDSGLSGIEFLTGIPGTLGGALWMNAGTGDKGIMDVVETIDLVDAQGQHIIARAGIQAGYRRAEIPPRTIITGACLHLRPGDKDAIAAHINRYLERRRAQPKGYSSGCIFKNPLGTSAGMLIDQAGLKGTRIGEAYVSETHANFIINTGGATCADIQALIARIKAEVKARFGIDLEEEVRFLG